MKGPNRRVTLVVAALIVAGGTVAVFPAQAKPRVAPSIETKATSATVDRVWSGRVTDEAIRPGAARTVRAPGSVAAAERAAEKAAARSSRAASGAARVAVPESKDPAAVPTMPVMFNGLDRPSSVNNGSTFTPPDTTVAKSPNRVLEGTNSALRLFSNAGGTLATSNLNTFFGAATASGLLFDPKVYYDRNAVNPRFFVVALQQSGRGDTNTANDVSRIWVAVSRSADPGVLTSGSWCRYNINGIRNAGTAQQSWADFPSIGAGRDSFSFTTNQFRFTTSAFTFAVINVWNKTVAENNAASCPSVPRFTWQPSATEGDFSRFTIQPAQHYTSPSSFTGTTNPAYYLSTRRGTSNEYRVYRVRNIAGGAPTLNQLTLTGTGYSIPADSPQPGSGVLVDTGDNRVLQVAGIGNTLLGTFTTGCNFTAGTAAESCTLSPRVTVGQSAAGAFTASIPENTFAGFGDNIFVHHPSIALNTALQAGSTWEFSGSARSLSSAAMTKNVNAAWVGVLTYAPGSCSQASTRSGDYSGAQTDPSTVSSFWLAGEQSVVISGVCQWRTRIGQLVP